MKINMVLRISAITVFAALAIIALNSSQAVASDVTRAELATIAMMENNGVNSNSVPNIISQDVEAQGTEDFVTTLLNHNNMPTIRVYIRGPHGFLQNTTHTYRTIFMVTGFETAKASTSLWGAMDDTVYVSFDYPFTQDEMQQDLAKILQTFRVTPAQIALSLKWVSTQSWVNRDKTVAMGVSLGGLFLPAALHMAMKMNAAPQRTVFAFTGCNLQSILGNILEGQLPQPAIDAAVLLIPTINTVNDPALHVPFLQGSFLVIHSDEDQIIPMDATNQLLRLLPDPKQEVLLHGPHIDINQKDLVDQTGKAITDWLNNN